MSASPFTWGTRVLAAGALLLALFLGVGTLLPSEWSAERSLVVPAEPGRVMAFLDSPEGWRAWTPWPDSGVVREGPPRGAGALVRWDHPELGAGAFEIVEVEALRGVRYAVEVEGGALRTAGSVRLEPAGGGTRVTWREEGDFGWNPLMGYWVLLMGDVQGEEMQKGLERLAGSLAGGGGAPEVDAEAPPAPGRETAPTDTGSAGAAQSRPGPG